MTGFTSARERRLWACLAAVVTTIYATLGLTRSLTGVLRDHGLLEVSFAIGVALIALAVLAFGIRARARGAEIAVALAIVAVYLLAFVRMSIPEERTHLLEYGLVAVLIHEALDERARHGHQLPARGICAVAGAAMLGGVDELIQGLLPRRVFDVRDLLFNLLAAAMAVIASTALRRVRRA